MYQYLNLLRKVKDLGIPSEDRTGTGTRSLFGESYRHNMQDGFPLLTTKHVSFKNVKSELLWFLSGNENIGWLHRCNNRIWDEWANEMGDIGPIYSHMVRWKDHDFSEINQLQNIIDEIRNNPFSRRLFLSNWNPVVLPSEKVPSDNPEKGKGALAPCHVSYQFRVNQSSGTLDLAMYQRSADVFLGVPYNLASCALLLSMVSHITGYPPGVFTHFFGDVHLYNNHIDQANEQLFRHPLKLPRLVLDPRVDEIHKFNMFNIKIVEYEHLPAIKAPISV